MYNKLMKCKNVEQLQYNKDKHFPNMSNKDLNYLNSLDDESQYPAARCAMGHLVYLYFRSSSGVAESMNNANKEMSQISPMNIMPIWWKRSQWRLQFPSRGEDHDEVGERGATSGL